MENIKQHFELKLIRLGGDRAVAEAVIHILKTFFEPYDTTKLPKVKTRSNEK